jgi:hypothetical protein
MSETEERVAALKQAITNVLADRSQGVDWVGTTDSGIHDEIARQGDKLWNGTSDCQLYLGPSERHPHPDFIGDYTQRFVVTDGTPVLDFEIRETPDHQQFFLRKIGPQDAIDAVPESSFDGSYCLADRIFAPGDHFRDDYYNSEVSRGYSLYTELCMGLKPTSIIEIGVRYGYSAWAMLRGCAPGTIYHGIDLRSVEQASVMLHREYPDMQLRLARADSGTLTHLSRTYDLAHVDGNHSHDGALHDLGLCLGRAKYILVDDVAAFCTVNSAMNEFLSRYPGLQAVKYDTLTGHVLLGPLPYYSNGG